jgi:hypothetical protein
MDASPNSTDLPTDVLADIQALADAIAAGQPVPPDVARRVHERAAHIRAEIYREHGLLDVGVPAIRELRGELSGS